MNWIDPIFFNKNKQEFQKTEYISTVGFQKHIKHTFPVLSAHDCKIIPHRQCEAYYNYRRTMPFFKQAGILPAIFLLFREKGNPCRVEAIRNSFILFSIVYQQVKIGEFRGELIKSIYREETLQRMKLSRKYKCRNLWEGFLLEEWTMKKALCEILAYSVCLREHSFSRTE